MEEDGEQVAGGKVCADGLQVLHSSQGAIKTHESLRQRRQVWFGVKLI